MAAWRNRVDQLVDGGGRVGCWVDQVTLADWP